MEEEIYSFMKEKFDIPEEDINYINLTFEIGDFV